jgi:uncharacterized OB-fold protein
MGLFRDLGRRVEEMKRAASDAADETATHECEDCGATLYTDHETCPECGSEAVVARESPDADE